MQTDKNKQETIENEDALIKPDPETLHTTDPQENMKGPISSLMQGIKEDFEEANNDAADSEIQDEPDGSK